MYKDAYNQGVSAKVRANVRQHATNIDQLNGSGKIKGGAYCPMNVNPVTDPETGKTYDNKCKMNAAKKTASQPASIKGMLGLGKCCERCQSCKCGRGMSGGAADTPISAKEWYKAQNRDFEETVAQTLKSPSTNGSRKDADLGAGKGRVCGGRAMGIGMANVTPRDITPPHVSRMRMKEDLGAGKFQGGARDDEDDYDDDDYEDGDDCGEMEGGAAEYSECDDEPETLREMKSICDDYEQKKLTGGAMTKRVRAMLPHGGKKMAVSLSKLLQKLKKRGRASFARRLKLGMAVPQLEGRGRYVGGAKDYDEISKIHDSVFGGGKLSGGYGPVAPTEEALGGYDNKEQPRGLMPPPSVNQQSGLRGAGFLDKVVKGTDIANKLGQVLLPEESKLRKGLALADKTGKVFGNGRVQQMNAMGYGASGGRQLIPVAQLPSKIGGGRVSKKGDYIGPSTGAIIPNLQSAAAPSGSGRGSRGAMVAKLMREKGMSLGEASKALKGGRYTANDFFQPRNIHQFFGAYA